MNMLSPNLITCSRENSTVNKGVSAIWSVGKSSYLELDFSLLGPSGNQNTLFFPIVVWPSEFFVLSSILIHVLRPCLFLTHSRSQ